MSPPDILARVESYYSGKIRAHGASPPGVDWSSAESQALRFVQLARLWEPQTAFSITDYGCGYGALLDRLRAEGAPARYVGFDVSREMLEHARSRHRHDAAASWVSDASALAPTDYAVASGVFNVKLDVEEGLWREYVLAEIETLARLGTRGFAFNALTSYSDPDRRRGDLHYSDPLQLFDHCKQRYSRRVALLHDYPLYEFTLIVRRSETD
jgi:SAM-dependent methyltransferase